MPGLSDQGLFESALARPQNRWAYQDANDVFDCAASYGFGIAKNHAFNDGNKRTAFQSMYAFLLLNGFRITAAEVAVVDLMIGVADSSVSETALAVWLRENSSRLRVKRAPK